MKIFLRKNEMHENISKKIKIFVNKCNKISKKNMSNLPKHTFPASAPHGDDFSMDFIRIDYFDNYQFSLVVYKMTNTKVN